MATKKHQALTIEQFPIQRYEFQAAKSDTEAGRFTGIASVFGSIVDTFPNRTRFRKGSFLKTINDRASRIKILSQHDAGAIWIGLPLQIKEVDEGLFLEASLNNTERGRDAAEALKHAASLGMLETAELSIGFDALNFEMVEDDDDGEIFRDIVEARLWEVSLVNFGADRQTKVMEAARLDIDKKFKADDPIGFHVSQIIELAAPPAPTEGHAGRVLSTKNKKTVKDAINALNDLLATAEPPTDEDAAEDEGTPESQALDNGMELIALAEAEASFARTTASI